MDNGHENYAILNWFLKLLLLTSSCVIPNTSLPAIELRKSLGLRPTSAAKLSTETWNVFQFDVKYFSAQLFSKSFLLFRPWIKLAIFQPISQSLSSQFIICTLVFLCHRIPHSISTNWNAYERKHFWMTFERIIILKI